VKLIGLNFLCVDGLGALGGFHTRGVTSPSPPGRVAAVSSVRPGKSLEINNVLGMLEKYKESELCPMK